MLGPADTPKGVATLASTALRCVRTSKQLHQQQLSNTAANPLPDRYRRRQMYTDEGLPRSAPAFRRDIMSAPATITANKGLRHEAADMSLVC